MELTQFNWREALSVLQAIDAFGVIWSRSLGGRPLAHELATPIRLRRQSRTSRLRLRLVGLSLGRFTLTRVGPSVG